MKLYYVLIVFALFNIFTQCEESKEKVYPKNGIYFSQDFLLAIKTEEPYKAYRDTLAIIDLDKLEEELSTTDKKLAFWINTYNSLVQAKIRDDINKFKDQDAFFKTKDQNIGHISLSLDQIENGILRKKKVDSDKVFFNTFQVDKLDPRIHFTLNCGASSCPPIAYYSPDNIEQQLVMAEEAFVQGTSNYNQATNTLEISQLFEWFEDDFGGNDGVLDVMNRLGIINDSITPSIIYSPYDWNLNLENY